MRKVLREIKPSQTRRDSSINISIDIESAPCGELNDIQPEENFFQIRINAENVGDTTTLLSGGQFYLLDETEKKHRAVFGDFSDEDLFNDDLKPNVPISRTTQFDIPFDENENYRIGILPMKEQSSNDIGIVCVLNC